MKASHEPSFARTAGAMSGMSRFLSKRDKHHKHHSLSSLVSDSHHDATKSSSTKSSEKLSEALDPSSPADFYGLFYDATKSAKPDEETKIKQIKQKILESKGVMLKHAQILWALRSQSGRGEVQPTYDLLVAMSNASEGILTPFDPATKLQGAVNRQMVTCFLDATLFSMFSRLDSFEAMLYNSFDDPAKERLAFLLRLWVNILRSGQLIATDITREIQESLAQCGWLEARELHQQDASEAFTFITEKLNLPLLTLKMDIYHTGKQDTDDHKFINERLLEVGIPTLENGEHPNEIKLEDCLEEYFNNRIEVKRYLERRSTLQSTKSNDKAREAGSAVHVETVEIEADSLTPMTPLSAMPSYMSDRPSVRHRAPSIIQERYIPDSTSDLGTPANDVRSPLGRVRGGSVRKEVLMPAWQFFSLIPWYTDHAPSSDAQVAAHFSSKRPVLGLCLKRYSYTNQGRAIRLATAVDIPLEIGLPHFIQDDNMMETGSLYGNFKLSLQSIVCHRGHSVDSGHYVALVRSNVPDKDNPGMEISHWLRFDDLASQRVALTDIHKALREETPYLLFYQILPVEGDPGNLTSGENPGPVAGTAEISKLSLSPNGESKSAACGDGDAAKSLSSKASGELQSTEESRGRSEERPQRRPSAISFTEYLPIPGRTSLEVPREQIQVVEHRKSGSFNSGLGRTLSKLSARASKSGEDLMASSQTSAGDGRTPTVHIDESRQEDLLATGPLDTVRSKSDPGLPGAHHAQHLPASTSGVSRSRSKREKSRSRLLKTGKGKAEDQDRECVVM